MDLTYSVTPLIAWATAGTLKFIINSITTGKPAFGLVGYGGLPSNHSAIVSSTVALIALRDGIGHPAFGVAVTVAFIVILDAASLRREVGLHAQHLNRLNEAQPAPQPGGPLRTRIGHSKLEILAGVLLGCAVGAAVDRWWPAA